MYTSSRSSTDIILPAIATSLPPSYRGPVLAPSLPPIATEASLDVESRRLDVELTNLQPNLARANNAFDAARRSLAVAMGVESLEGVELAGSLLTLDLPPLPGRPVVLARAGGEAATDLLLDRGVVAEALAVRLRGRNQDAPAAIERRLATARDEISAGAGVLDVGQSGHHRASKLVCHHRAGGRWKGPEAIRSATRDQRVSRRLARARVVRLPFYTRSRGDRR